MWQKSKKSPSLFAHQVEVCCSSSTSRVKLECDFCLGYQYHSVRRLAKYTSRGNGIIMTTHILQQYSITNICQINHSRKRNGSYSLGFFHLGGREGWDNLALPSKCCGFFIRRQCNAMFRYFRNFKSELGMVWTDTATKESILFPY
jgi:hypothetical protein